MSFSAILKDLEGFLRYEAEEGATHLALDRALLDALGAPPPPRARAGGIQPDLLTPVMPLPSVSREDAGMDAPSPPGATQAAKGGTSEPSSATGEPEKALADIAAEVALCHRCPLGKERTRTVPGQGNPHPDIVFVGEGPGADEDRAGLAFVGRAGQLLTRMIEAMGYAREDVFICNVVKCRPPGNRVPEPSEMAACLPYLKRQLAALHPKVIVTLGATALSGLVELPKDMGITKVRGTWQTFQGIELMPTFHPAYLLRNGNMKTYVWEDLKTVLKRLGRPIPKVSKRS